MNGGNEMYDDSRGDVMARYPEPSDYANAMLPWVHGIKKDWPDAKVAPFIKGGGGGRCVNLLTY